MGANWRSKYENDALARMEELEEAKKKLAVKLQDAEEQTENALSKFASLEKSKARLAAEFEDLQVAFERQTVRLANADKKQRNFDKDFAAQASKYEEVNAELEAAQKAFRDLSADNFKLSQSYDESQDAYAALKKEWKNLKDENGELADQLATGGKSLYEVGKAKKKAEADYEEMKSAVSSVFNLSWPQPRLTLTRSSLKRMKNSKPLKRTTAVLLNPCKPLWMLKLRPDLMPTRPRRAWKPPMPTLKCNTTFFQRTLLMPAKTTRSSKLHSRISKTKTTPLELPTLNWRTNTLPTSANTDSCSLTTKRSRELWMPTTAPARLPLMSLPTSPMPTKPLLPKTLLLHLLRGSLSLNTKSCTTTGKMLLQQPNLLKMPQRRLWPMLPSFQKTGRHKATPSLPSRSSRRLLKAKTTLWP